ncbi:Nicotinamide riboside kinase [Trichoderma ghanense]|uniref:Nicotinamide riboside kinase n=1 Tax=Trichoderma ghanense TaxID=65468 RepID=A0ABY2H2Q7_9HYPO
MPPKKALVVALSGCSSSGKTTLARLLRDIFPSTFILHEDDFYRPEAELPIKHGLVDWDCPESIDIPAMADALSYIRENASFPPTLDSKEDQNSVGPSPIPPSLTSTLRQKVLSSLPPSHPLLLSTSTSDNKEPATTLKICILDGFLLYTPAMSSIQPHLDLKIFLRASYAKAKARREARDGYVTLEGFWADPPGYVDKIVWPNYVESHAWLFEDGDVEGKFKKDVLEREGIRVPEGEPLDGDMEATLTWIVDLLLEELKKYA